MGKRSVRERIAATLAIAGCVLIAAAIGCSRPQPASTAAVVAPTEPFFDPMPEVPFDGKIRIASIFPAYGRYAISGEESHRGVRLAEEAATVIHGREVEVLYYRTGSEPLDVRYAAASASDAGALAIVGCNASSLSISIRKLAQTRGIPMVSNVSSVPGLTYDLETGKNYGFAFRVCHNDLVIGRFLAECARERLRADSAAVLYDVSRAYSTNLASTFTQEFLSETYADRPGEVRSYYYAPLETDFRRQLREIARFDPDVLFVPGSFTDASLITSQAEALGLRAILLGGDSWSNRLLFKRGAPKRAVYHADHWFSEGPFRELYEQRYDDEPNGARAALAHDALGVLLQVVENLGPLTDRNLSPEGIAHTRDRLRISLSRVVYEGATGTIAFDEYGEPPQHGVIVKIENGERSLFMDLEGR